ncbi:DUF726 domain-containing protein [Halocatena marina]|uniref:DUF726 domain-containing protein n=1 Tax=Halocatena marina TaxID=2934937 RepID=UPI00200C0643|nr:DUF726 domain-containing protein [Halocatena marina]
MLFGNTKHERAANESVEHEKSTSRRQVLKATTSVAVGIFSGGVTIGTAKAGGCTSFLDAPDDFPYIWYTSVSGSFPSGDPTEILIFVHGWQEKLSGGGRDQAYTCKRAVRDSGYPHPVVGFGYDSNNPWWWSAKDDAEEAGHSFADWLTGYVDSHRTYVRLVAHSLGARVSLTALNDLASRGRSVGTLDLLGGAVDADEIGDQWSTGIQNGADHVNNWHSDNDSVLDSFYWAGEAEEAVGEEGAQGPHPPSTYSDHDVTDTIDAHCEYILPERGCLPQVVDTF